MTGGLPPYPADDRWKDWAMNVYDWMRNRDQSRGEILPQTVLMEHQSTNELARATADGLLMFDPVQQRPVYSHGGAWHTFDATASLTYNALDDAGDGTPSGDINATDFTGQAGAIGTCAQCEIGTVVSFYHKGTQYIYAGPRPASYGAGCADTMQPGYLTPSGTGLFTALADTPSEYTAAGGYFVTVNPGETALTFSPDAASDQHGYSRKNAGWARSGVENHSSLADYEKDDLVSFEGTVYHCTTTHTAQAFSLDNWRPIAATVGTGAKFNYDWSNNTAGPIPNGGFAINAANALDATEVLVSGITASGNDISPFWQQVQAGDYTGFAEDSGGAEYCYFQITGPAVQTDDWFTVPVAPLPNSINGDPENSRSGLVSILGNPDNRLPPGGDPGYGLMKLTAADYDTGWRPFVVPGYGGIRGVTSLPLADIGIAWVTLEATEVEVSTPLDVVQNLTNHTLTYSRPGIWNLSIGFSISHDEAQNSRDIHVRVYNVTDGVGSFATVIGIGRNTDATTWSVSTLFEISEADVGKEWRVELGDGDVLTLVTQNSFSFSTHYVSEWRGDA